jgi:hypothetical protein
MSMIWSTGYRNRSCLLVPRRSRGRIANPSLHQHEQHGRAIRGNPRILQGNSHPKAENRQIRLAGLPNHSDSRLSNFFTDDLKTTFPAKYS